MKRFLIITYEYKLKSSSIWILKHDTVKEEGILSGDFDREKFRQLIMLCEQYEDMVILDVELTDEKNYYKYVKSQG